MLTKAYDSNNVLIADLGDIPTVPQVGDFIIIAHGTENRYTSGWVVTGRALFHRRGSDKLAGMYVLKVERGDIGSGLPNIVEP